MIEKRVLSPERVRKITGSFAFIEHRFLRQGFFETLSHHELVLYVFLILVADRNGLSYYSYDKICTLLRLSVDEYVTARNALIEKDLLAFDGHWFQVLSLPHQPLRTPVRVLKTCEEMSRSDPATIHLLFKEALGGDHD
jgi:hypothetical protein